MVVTGRAGSGKSTLSGSMARVAAAKGLEVLVVHDQSGGTLGVALGEDPDAGGLVIPEDLLARTRGPDGESAFELAKSPAEIVTDYGRSPADGVTLVELSPTTHTGSNLVHNQDRTAQEVVTALVRDREEVTVVDAVAGVEGLPSDAVDAVDVLLVVVEPHYKSLEMGRRATELAEELGFSDIRVIANKVKNSTQHAGIEEFCAGNGVDLGTVVPFEEAIERDVESDRAPVDASSEVPGVRMIHTVTEDLLSSYFSEGDSGKPNTVGR